MLVYLANKGYLQITETEHGKFKITKLKDYDGTNENEKVFFDGLFNNKNVTLRKYSF